jgi:Sec-independent protein translocase protein TatA
MTVDEFKKEMEEMADEIREKLSREDIKQELQRCHEKYEALQEALSPREIEENEQRLQAKLAAELKKLRVGSSNTP